MTRHDQARFLFLCQCTNIPASINLGTWEGAGVQAASITRARCQGVSAQGRARLGSAVARPGHRLSLTDYCCKC